MQWKLLAAEHPYPTNLRPRVEIISISLFALILNTCVIIEQFKYTKYSEPFMRRISDEDFDCIMLARYQSVVKGGKAATRLSTLKLHTFPLCNAKSPF